MDVTTTAASAAFSALGSASTAVFTDAPLPPPIQIPLNLTCYFTPSQSLASENQLLFSRYVNGYLTGACVIGGTIGNVMSVRSVRLSNFERNRGIGLAVAIIVLAVWDTLMLWCAIAYYGLKNLIPTPANDWAILATPFFHGFSQVTHTASVWSVVTITVQRYMATRDPFRNTRWLLYIASADLHEQHRAMFCSFRNGSCAPPNSANSHTPATGFTSNGVCTSSGGGNSVKWHRGLLGGGGGSAQAPPALPQLHYASTRHHSQTLAAAATNSCGVGQRSSGAHRALGLVGSAGAAAAPSTLPTSALATTANTGATTTAALYPKYSSDWKAPSSLWKYLVRYRRHFRMPCIISVLAILVNIPAFFEITAVPCYYFPEYRIIYKLYVSHFRLNDYYKFWYRMVFRMLVTTCGPNIFILCLTVITVLLLRGTNRSRQRLFHNNELAIEQYSSRAKMLTTISICLAVKFLLLRSLTFMLDIWEVAYGFKREVHRYLYAVDISNFLIILNSSTNCLIIYGFSRWLHHKISARNIEKREKQHCLNSINTKRRTMLLHDSWQKALISTHRQIGNKILYAMLLKHPQMFAPFRDATTPSCGEVPSRCSSTAQQPSNFCNNDGEISDDGGGCAHDDEARNGCIRRPRSVSLASNSAPEPATNNKGTLLDGGQIGNDIGSNQPHGKPITSLSSVVVDSETAKLLPSITITTPLLDNNGDAVDDNGNSKPAPVINVEAAAAATLSVISKKKKRSIDLLMNAKFYEFGEQIVRFFDDLIQMMQQGSYEQAVIAKIQQVGKIHYDHGITFPSSAWKEFKTTALSIFGDCEYDNEADRAETLEAWSSFLSIIIHNMKLGMWTGGNRYSIYASNNNNVVGNTTANNNNYHHHQNNNSKSNNIRSNNSYGNNNT